MAISAVREAAVAGKEGAWHESVNIAAMRAVPVIFLCENNSLEALGQQANEYPSSTLAAKELTDEDVEAVLRTQVKRRDEAAEAFREGGRDEAADQELAERAILSEYLPKGLGDAELEALVDRALADGGFTEPAQMGQAMKAVMAEVAGRADGKVVSGLVKARLTP